MSKQRHASAGFTIIELLIATVVFSVVLLVITTAIVQFGRLYYRGIVQARTQEVARNIAQDVAQNIQFGGTSPVNGTNALCIGGKRYSMVQNKQVGNGGGMTAHALVLDTNATTCQSINMSGSLPAGAREFLGDNMQLVNLAVRETAPNSGLWQVEVHVVYGDNDSFTDGSKSSCKAIILGGQFCAVSKLTTTVTQRL